MARFAVALLVLLASSALLDFAEATNNKKRFDALAAGQPKKPKRGAAGKKDGETKTRAERFGECMNKLNEKVGVARRKGDRPEKVRGRTDKFAEASDSCADIDTYACTSGNSGGNSGGGGDTNTTGTNSTGGAGRRRLVEMVLGINLREMSIEESKARMRELLQAVNDDEDLLETATFDTDDDEQNAIGESVAANMGDDNLEDFCTLAEDDTMDEMIRRFAGKKEFQKPKDTGGGSGGGNGNGGSINGASAQAMSGVAAAFQGVERKTLKEQLALLKEIRVQASTRVGGQFASTQATDTSCGRGSQGFVKKATGDKVECAATGLVNAVFPAYMKTSDSTFRSAMSGMETFGIVKRPDQQEDNNIMYKEYSDGNKWADLYLTKAVFETTLNTLNQALDSFGSACDIQAAFATWVGVGGGAAITPSETWCGGVALGMKIALWVVELGFVTTVGYLDSGAAGHDSIVLAVEMEATAENVVSVIHNQQMTFTEVGTRAQRVIDQVKASENNTKTTVRAAAGDTVGAIVALEDTVNAGFADMRAQLAALQQQLASLINQRACESTTQVAAVHHTVNHMQRMMLVPEGSRPGWNKNGIVLACETTDPVLCSAANATRTMTVNQICPMNVARPGTGVVSAAPLVMSAGAAPVAGATAAKP